MKSKPKSAFANTSTGYGRHKHSGHSKGHAQAKEKAESKDITKLEVKEEQEKDLNSGFGDYLRTPEAWEMMKLFVFANTIVIILTMAWPNIKIQYTMLSEW
ncbi:Xport, partial [Drosophila busckii]